MTIYNYITEICKDVEKPFIVEVGAHHCEDSMAIMEAAGHPNKPVIYTAFEPDPRNVNFIYNSDVGQHLMLVPLAVGAEDGETELYQSSGNIDPHGDSWTGSSSIHKPKKHLEAFPWCKFDDKTIVRITKLDHFFKEVDVIDFIWSDIQGAEGDMVKGGQEVLKKTRYLYSEYSDVELYEGQMPLNEWMKLLPGKWKIVEKFTHDVLLAQEL